MMRTLLKLALFLFALDSSPAWSAPLPRPLSGCGVVTLIAPHPDAPLTVYREPGVQRVTQLSLRLVPQLARGGETALAALGRRGSWLKISYDDAERQGWVKGERHWEFLPWREALPGSRARLLPAMKKGYYAVRETPEGGGALQGELSRDQLVRIVAVREDWALAEAPAGWFRWRDEEGRLTISLEPPLPEKR